MEERFGGQRSPWSIRAGHIQGAAWLPRFAAQLLALTARSWFWRWRRGFPGASAYVSFRSFIHNADSTFFYFRCNVAIRARRNNCQRGWRMDESIRV